MEFQGSSLYSVKFDKEEEIILYQITNLHESANGRNITEEQDNLVIYFETLSDPVKNTLQEIGGEISRLDFQKPTSVCQQTSSLFLNNLLFVTLSLVAL